MAQRSLRLRHAARVLGKDEHDIEIAFEEWGKHKRNIGVFTSTFPQLENLLDKGEMWLGAALPLVQCGVG